MADILWKDDEVYCKRFACGCFDPAHVIDIEVLKGGEGITVFIEFNESFVGFKYPLLRRVKNAIKLLLGREIYNHGFNVRLGDIDEMIEILKSAKEAK